MKIEIPANKTFTVVMSASEKSSKYSSINFTLKTYSIFPSSLEKASEELPHKSTIEGHWTTELSGGSWSYQTYLDNPRYLLKLKEKTNVIKLLLYSPLKSPMNIRMFSESDKYSRDIGKKLEQANSGEYRISNTSSKAVYIEPGEYTIVLSQFEPNITGPFTFVCRSSSSFELTPLPSIAAGCFHRSSVVPWDESSRIEIDFTVPMKSTAYFRVIAYPDNDCDNKPPELLSYYRPHMRFSIFNKTSGQLIKSNDKFTDDRLGIYLDNIQLFSNTEYVCLVERMECGTGRFCIQVDSQSPVVLSGV